MFELTHDPIQPPAILRDEAGGFVSFEGRVRNHADGRSVHGLEYEAYEELAVSEGARLLAEAVERYALTEARVVHRLGRLSVGDMAVWIGVAAAHRREAFAGCEWIIDQIKHRVPIWKRELFADGRRAWVGAESQTDDVLDLTERQARLAEIGPEGQTKLRRASVLVVGVGGLGSAALPYLVGAGIGRVGLVDPDAVEPSNLHRQVIYGVEEVGRLKVDRAAALARRLNPWVQVDAYPERLTEANADRLVCSYDWVLDGTDSLWTKAVLNAACRRAGRPLVTAAVHRFEGHLMTVRPDGPCLNCLFPEPPSDGCVGACAEVGVVGVVPGVLGLLQANEVIRGIVGYAPTLDDELLWVDLRSCETQRLRRSIRPGCAGCQGMLAQPELEVASLADARSRWGDGYELLDIREAGETPELQIPHRRVPLSRFALPPTARPVVLVCARGVRSAKLASELRRKGHAEVFSLRGGCAAL